MKASTVAELAGFVLLSVAAWMLNPIAGFATAGVSCLLIGYGTEDQAAALAIGRIIDPWRARRQQRKAARAARRQQRRNKS